MDINSYSFYDQLVEKVKNSKIPYDIKKHIGLINSLDENNLEVIHSIILHHYVLENKSPIKMITDSKNKNKKCLVPYGAKIFDTGRGIIYQVSSLPNNLQDILTELLQRMPL